MGKKDKQNAAESTPEKNTAQQPTAGEAAKTAETNSIVDLIPMLNDGVYVVQSTGSQLRYISVPKGYLQDKLGEYRDDASGYAAADGDAPICTYYVLFTDCVIGLADGNTGFVSADRTATGTKTTTPDGFYDFVASFFSNSTAVASSGTTGSGTDANN